MQKISTQDLQDKIVARSLRVYWNRQCLHKHFKISVDGDPYVPHVNLFASVIAHAAEDADREYFEGDVFTTHCQILGLEKTELMKLVRYYWLANYEVDNAN